MDSTAELTDSRDGKKYKTVKIGDQVWMAENLAFECEGSKCYGNDPANCDMYGRLYDWQAAFKACPKGWHLPTKAEWDTLTAAVGGEETEGKRLKAKSGWNESGNGEDTYGFAALPGGDYGDYGSVVAGNSEGNFGKIGIYGFWWTASENGSNYAYYRGMLYNYENAYWDHGSKLYGFSVRCVKD